MALSLHPSQKVSFALSSPIQFTILLVLDQWDIHKYMYH